MPGLHTRPPLWAVLTALCVLGCVAALAFGLPGPAGVAKMAASCGFLGMAWSVGALRLLYGRLIVAGLFCSWWGDLFLIFSGEAFFLLGLVAFLCAHLVYGAAFIFVGVRVSATVGAAVLFLAPSGVITAWLWPELGALTVPVLGYVAVITAMVALAIGAWSGGGNGWMPLAAGLFYLSDVLVARQAFITESVWNPAIGLPLYYAAQLAFVQGVAVHRRMCAGTP